MVIYCAVGGRLSLFGAIYGTLLVNYAKTVFSEVLPEVWLFAMGALFIGVVMAFPNGIAGLYQTYLEPKVRRLLEGGGKEPDPVDTSSIAARPAE